MLNISINKCSECPFLYYNRIGLLKCSLKDINLVFKSIEDNRFPKECPLKLNSIKVEIEPIIRCGKCGWVKNSHCNLYNSILTPDDNDYYREPICIKNERNGK
jgi:hypothetical protein